MTDRPLAFHKAKPLSRSVTTEEERNGLMRLIERRAVPFTVTIVSGKHRSLDQNRLQRLWMNDIAQQLDDQTPEQVRGYCKLTLGVPILRAENDAFCAQYDEHVKPLDYETKLALMMEPLDLPVTRLFSTDQHRRYLDAIHQHFSDQGIALTMPEHASEAA